MPALLFVLLLPIVEIALFVVIGGRIGVLATLLAVLVSAAAGVLMIRREGMAALSAARAGAVPASGLLGSLVTLMAAVLLILPGFLTSALGLVLLLPPVRRRLADRYGGEIYARTAGFRAGRGPGGEAGRPPPRAPEVIEGDWSEVDPPKRPTHPTSGWTRH